MRYTYSVTAVLVAAVVRTALSEPSNTLDTASLSIGVKEWPSITNGVVFIDGMYIPPPYVVSRREGELFLNGLHLDWVMKWPPKEERQTPIPKVDPIMPSSITEKSTKYDPDYIRYMSDKQAYIFAKYGQEKGMDLMVEAYKQLPIVVDAVRDSDSKRSIFVKWKSGAESHIDHVAPEVKRDNLTRAQAEQYVDRMAEIYVRGLGDNNYFLLGSSGGQRGTKEAFGRTLVPLADAMRAAKDEAEFLSIMQTNQPVGGLSEKTLRSFYKYKAEVPKWEPRLRGYDSK
jgi:hypothetical protein